MLLQNSFGPILNTSLLCSVLFHTYFYEFEFFLLFLFLNHCFVRFDCLSCMFGMSKLEIAGFCLSKLQIAGFGKLICRMKFDLLNMLLTTTKIQNEDLDRFGTISKNAMRVGSHQTKRRKMRAIKKFSLSICQIIKVFQLLHLQFKDKRKFFDLELSSFDLVSLQVNIVNVNAQCKIFFSSKLTIPISTYPFF